MELRTIVHTVCMLIFPIIRENEIYRISYEAIESLGIFFYSHMCSDEHETKQTEKSKTCF